MVGTWQGTVKQGEDELKQLAEASGSEREAMLANQLVEANSVVRRLEQELEVAKQAASSALHDSAGLERAQARAAVAEEEVSRLKSVVEATQKELSLIHS